MSVFKITKWSDFQRFFDDQHMRRDVDELVARVTEHAPSQDLLDRSQWIQLTKKWAVEWPILFESLLLKKVLADPKLIQDQTRWAARIWSQVTEPKGTWPTDNLLGDYKRWHPLEKNPSESLDENDAKMIVRNIYVRMESRYEVPFPVVSDNRELSALITARVTRLGKPQSADASSEDVFLAGLPTIVLAPWSEYYPVSDYFNNLTNSLSRLKGNASETRFLLELQTPPAFDPADAVVVEENSSDLSAILAVMLMDQPDPYLKPFVATGDNSANLGQIGHVGDVEEKWLQVERYAKARREQVSFLIPPSNYETLFGKGAKLGAIDPVTPFVETISVPENVANLFAFVKDKLSDEYENFDTFLKGKGVKLEAFSIRDSTPDAFEVEDIEELTAIAKSAAEDPHVSTFADAGLMSVVLPFNNDPRRAANHVAAKVLECENPRFKPLILPIYGDDYSKTAWSYDLFDELARRIATTSGTIDVPNPKKIAMPTETDMIPRQAARNLIAHHQPRVLLILHDRRSIDVSYDQPDLDRVKELWSFLKAKARDVTAILIASDWHHFQCLVELGLAQVPPQAAASVEESPGKPDREQSRN